MPSKTGGATVSLAFTQEVANIILVLLVLLVVLGLLGLLKNASSY
jgi:hypothetical protein